MAEAFIQPVTQIVCCFYAPIARHVKYSRKLSSNVQDLRDKAEELRAKRDDINGKIDQLKPQKAATNECESWIAKVKEMEGRVETINNELNAPKKCLGGLCPDVFARIKLGKSVVNTIGEVKELLEKFKPEGDEFLTHAPPTKVEKRPDPESKLTTSAHKMLEEMLNKIRDKNNSKIGIWGMGGIGKTTVLLLLKKSPEISSMFDFVIWVTVSHSWNIKKLQDEIGKRLKMGTTNDESENRAALFGKLVGKRYLLLLDDVWEHVDLSSIGLPNATEDNGCKVVLTTRKWEVCRKMKTDIEIKVGGLSEDEARQMFYSNVGDVVESSPTIRQLAEEIVRECGGLPLALKVVSGALQKKENVNVWRKFLRDLKSPATFFIKDLNEEVFRPLKISYDRLEELQKQCFLYCGLYPEDYEIVKSELIDYWRAEGLVSHECSLEEAWIEGDIILQALIDSSLLERCEGRDDFVKLQDVLRDLVLALTSPKGSEECKHLVRAGFIYEEEKMPKDEKWTKATRISFIENDLRNLPQSPQCPLLITLLLQHNYGLEEIPESFFFNMPKLGVLDLSGTGIKSLPASLSYLVSLRSLFLRDCRRLEVLPETISAPKGLEMLEITGGNISQVPFWISELTALKCLKLLSDKRMTVPRKVICSLSRMEVFACSMLTDESEEIVVNELSMLTTVSSLTFEFSGVSNLQHFLESSISWIEERLSTFYFVVDQQYPRPQLFSYFQIKDEKKITYAVGNEEGNGILPGAIEKVICRSNYFELTDHGKINTLSDLGAQNTCNLKQCIVRFCGELENIIDKNGLEMNVFPKLESLELSYLENLRYILCLEPEGPLPSPPPSVNIFTNLKKLALESCTPIKMVFSSGFMIRLLSNLEDLFISNCKRLEGMISKDEYEHDDGALPKLKEVSLQNLPEFVSFFRDVTMRFPSLKKVKITNCLKLRNLPTFNFRADMKIEVQPWWWDKLEWDNNTIKSQFQPTFIH